MSPEFGTGSLETSVTLDGLIRKKIMAKLVRLNAELRENFVAYLDGELTEEQSRTVEQALATNQVARHEIEALARTWELLDSLPRNEATGDFTHRTMKTVATLDAPTEMDNSVIIEKFHTTVKSVVWVAGMVAVAVLGFWATHSLIPQPSDELVKDLPIIENLDRYQEVGSTDFLNKLQSEPLWQQRPKKGGRK